MAVEHPLQRLPEILEQMKAVSYLDCSGCALPSSFSVLSAPITADDGNAGMAPQPGGKGSCAAVGQQVNHLMSLQVHEHAAVGAATAEGEVIDTQYPWRRPTPKRKGVQMAQHRITRDQNAEVAQQTGARFTAERESDVRKPRVESRGPSPVGRDHTWQAFGEYLALTGEIVTEEPPNVEPEPHRQLLPGQIGEVTKIAGMDTPRYLTAEWTRCPWTGGLNAQRNTRGVGREQDEPQLIGVGENRRAWHACVPSTGIAASGLRYL
jgi:hypothetical protein